MAKANRNSSPTYSLVLFAPSHSLRMGDFFRKDVKTKTAADDTAVEHQMLQQALTQQQKLLQKTVQTMHTQLLQCIKALQQLY